MFCSIIPSILVRAYQSGVVLTLVKIRQPSSGTPVANKLAYLVKLVLQEGCLCFMYLNNPIPETTFS